MRFCNFKKQFAKKKSMIKKITLPFSAAIVFITTVSYWNNIDYGLALEYNGQQIATISDEKVYQEANHLIRNEMNLEKTSNILKISPNIKITPISQDKCCKQAEIIKDKIIENSSDILLPGFAIYVDNKVIAIGDNEENINEILNEILEVSKTPYGSCIADFEEKVEVKAGLFLSKKILPEHRIRQILEFGNKKKSLYVVKEGDSIESIAESFDVDPSYLLAVNNRKIDEEICVGNKLNIIIDDSFVHAKITRDEVVENEVGYETIIEEDENLDKGKRIISQEGQKGKEKVTYKVEYIQNKEINRKEIARELIIEPIPEKIILGTKVQEYIWPVPYTKNITSPYGPRDGGYHYGIDIAWPGVNGTEILASKAGKVERASLGNTGYGNHIIINHNDGTQTLYAHCKSLNVSVNQTVNQGDVIAFVGTTGQSTGPHLHFEVRVNGARKNPSNYIY